MTDTFKGGDFLLTKEQRENGTIGLIVTLMIGYTIAYMDKAMISTAIIPISAEYQLSSTEAGFIMSAFFLSYSLTQIPSGWLADQFGAKAVLLTALSLTTVFALLFGLVSNLLMFMLFRFFAGVGHGGYPPGCSRAIGEYIPKKQRTFIQSLMIATAGLGGILAFTLGANLIALNWRYAYLLLGTFFFIATVFVALFLPGKAKNSTTQKTKNNKPNIKYRTILVNKNVIRLFLAMILINFLLYGIVSWLPSYLKTTFSLSIGTIGLLLACNAVFQTLGSFLAGILMSRYFAKKERRLIVCLCLATALFLLGFMYSSVLALSMILLLLLSLCSTTAFTAMFSWPHKLFDSSIIGSAIGLINTGSAIGGFIAPMTLGFLIQLASGSYVLSFCSMALAVIICGCIVLFINKK